MLMRTPGAEFQRPGSEFPAVKQRKRKEEKKGQQNKWKIKNQGPTATSH